MQNVNVPTNFLGLIEIWSFLNESKKVEKRSKVESIFWVNLLPRPNPKWSILGHPKWAWNSSALIFLNGKIDTKSLLEKSNNWFYSEKWPFVS